MTKLIVGCGYLGKRVAHEWTRRGEEVYALTRSEERAVELQRLNLIPLIGDIASPDLLPEFPKVDTLLYAVGYDRAATLPRRQITVDGLAGVLERVRGRVRHLIYISTSSVYGKNDGEWVDAATPCVPVEENGLLALEAEQLVRDEFPTHSTQKRMANILRLSGIYGPGRLLARQQSLLKGEPLGGNPDAWLNLIHVTDAVSAIEACLTHGTAGETYLISDQLPIPRREYYTRLASLIGAPTPTFASASTEGGPLNKRCDSRASREQLQWSLRYPTILEGLPDAVRSHPD